MNPSKSTNSSTNEKSKYNIALKKIFTVQVNMERIPQEIQDKKQGNDFILGTEIGGESTIQKLKNGTAEKISKRSHVISAEFKFGHLIINVQFDEETAKKAERKDILQE